MDIQSADKIKRLIKLLTESALICKDLKMNGNYVILKHIVDSLAKIESLK
jgi:hypothetical protein